MRVTNSMINHNSMSNMNANKVLVNELNNQMTSQKKISRPSEDPVVAIRALRLRGNLNELNQYYEKNIPDAESWMEVTEGALNSMKSILSTIRTQCVNATTGTMNQEDRQAILKNLQSLRKQVYAEGNADYAGRTVFTGYKTNTALTFSTDELNTKYQVTEPLSYEDIEENSYYSYSVVVPGDRTQVLPGVDLNAMPKESVHKRIRLSYENMEAVQADDLKYKNAAGALVPLSGYSYTDSTGATQQPQITTNLSYADWKKGGYQVADNQVIVLKETGEVILGKNVASQISSNKMELSVDYTKQGFSEGELRPEHYFDCKNITDPNNTISYTKENQELEYTVSFNQTLIVNTQASDVFDTSIGRDVDELTNSVENSIAAHKKVDSIKAMMKESQYSDPAAQEALSQWLKAAEKEVSYADDNMEKVYSQGITAFDGYLKKVTLANTDLGSRGDRLKLTKNRMSNQQATFEELKSKNEDKELSDIIIEYTSAHTAYQASMQASAKANSQTLLSYL
ncbi:MAG: flagellin [Lachnospiraceae bacterium]